MTLLEKINNLTWHNLINKLKDILKGLIPQEPKYKVYTALLTQSGTDAPVATVLENTLGGEVVWSREGEGAYIATSNNLFNNSNIMILFGITNTFDSEKGVLPFLIQKYVSNSNIITINTYSITADIKEDGFLYETPIEIRVYS